MKRGLCLLFGWLALNFSAAATGLIIVHDDGFWRRPPPRIVLPETIPRHRPPIVVPRPSHPVWAPLEASFTKAEVRIRDQFATTVIDQEFYNPNPQQLEGTFLFPVPK